MIFFYIDDLYVYTLLVTFILESNHILNSGWSPDGVQMELLSQTNSSRVHGVCGLHLELINII
jgi:hypothetical protein